jgi:hypothetical protein
MGRKMYFTGRIPLRLVKRLTQNVWQAKYDGRRRPKDYPNPNPLRGVKTGSGKPGSQIKTPRPDKLEYASDLRRL